MHTLQPPQSTSESYFSGRNTRTTHTQTTHTPSQHGFTLLELLVVIVIIGMLAGLVAPRYFDTVGKSKAKVARAQMDSLEKALEQYRLEVGAFPSQDQGLDALITQPTGVAKWQGPYLKKGIPLDPWRHPYVYQVSDSRREIDLVSLGSDGQPGGEAEAKDIRLSAPE
ncbi:MAG: type II secretion system major pseudopilin GspG [Rhodoferax sp.]